MREVVPKDAGAALVALHLQDNLMARLVKPFTRATAESAGGLHTVPRKWVRGFAPSLSLLAERAVGCSIRAGDRAGGGGGDAFTVLAPRSNPSPPPPHHTPAFRLSVDSVSIFSRVVVRRALVLEESMRREGRTGALRRR